MKKTSHCQLQRGVFIERTCGREAEVQCEKCQRPICRKHQTLAALPSTVCVLCIPPTTSEDSAWEDDHARTYGWRDRRYSGGRSPMLYYADTHPHQQHDDDRDHAAFDSPTEKAIGDDAFDDHAFGDGAGFDDDDGISAFDS